MELYQLRFRFLKYLKDCPKILTVETSEIMTPIVKKMEQFDFIHPKHAADGIANCVDLDQTAS